LLLQVATWRWIFFINIPVGLLGIAAVLRIVPRLRHRHPGRFDGCGFVAAAVGIVAIMLVSESFGSDLLSGEGRIIVALIALAAWVVFVRHALRVPAPMLDLRLLAKPTYRASMLGGSCLRLGIGATPFLIPLLLQSGLGWSPIKAGAAMAAMSVGSLLARFGGTYSIRSWGFRTAMIVTAALTALFTAAPALFDRHTSIVFIVSMLLAVAFFRAAHYVAATAIAFADVSADELSRASTLSTVIQQISMSFGISFAALALYLSGGTGNHFTANQFVMPFVALGVATFLAVPVYTRLDSQAGAHMRIGGKRLA
jgi:predicted MFS family arabinose efflux permease